MATQSHLQVFKEPVPPMSILATVVRRMELEEERNPGDHLSEDDLIDLGLKRRRMNRCMEDVFPEFLDLVD